MATSTVSAVLARIGLGRLSRLQPPEPVRRYERSHPGELIHIDVKKLGRIGPNAPGHRVTGWKIGNRTTTDAAGRVRRRVGWECVHVCVDDATRLAYAEVRPDERTPTVIGFLGRARAFYRSHGIEVERLMTDNGSAYRSAPPRLQGDGHPSYPHPALPTSDQRQGRALHQDDARGVGLRGGLRLIPPRAPQASRGDWSATTTGDDTAPSVTGRPSSGYGRSKGTTWPASTVRARRSRPGRPA
jgi:hypothetical protein